MTSSVDDLLDEYGGADLSLAHLLCDRHPADAPAFTIVDADLNDVTLTYGQLREASERLAAALAELGVGPGDRVATLMGKSVDYVTTVVAIWRLGAVHVPLFTAFAPPAIALRLEASRAKAVVCDDGQRAKLDPSDDIPADAPWRVVLAGSAAERREGDLLLQDLLDGQEAGFPAAALGRDAPMIHIFTSGTTGTPKGVVVPGFALAAIQAYLEYGYDVREDDVFWCAADPGWAYGLYYAIVGPLALGVRSLLLDAPSAPDLIWAVLSRYRVTNFAAAPTVYRSLRAASDEVPDVALRVASSAGEPLTPDVNEWATGALGVAVHDHYGQTEAGMLVNNHHHPDLARPLKPGSMGRPMPGWSIHVLEVDRDEPAEVGVVGRIAVDMTASPLAWFHAYHEAPEATASKFSPDRRWYHTGDTASMDEDGDVHFTSRDDDIIIMAGYRIGPFEVESVLNGHPAVLESAAIAVPDEIRGELLEAHVVLNAGYSGSPELVTELQQLVKQKLAAHAYPRNVLFIDEMPKTPSGKIQRFVLRDQRHRELAP
jgi:acetyl-CoA synthetase